MKWLESKTETGERRRPTFPLEHSLIAPPAHAGLFTGWGPKL